MRLAILLGTLFSLVLVASTLAGCSHLPDKPDIDTCVYNHPALAFDCASINGPSPDYRLEETDVKADKIVGFQTKDYALLNEYIKELQAMADGQTAVVIPADKLKAFSDVLNHASATAKRLSDAH